MLQMDLDCVVGVSAIWQNRRLKSDLSNRRVPAPFAHALTAFARPGPQIVEHVIPARLPRKRGRGRVE